MRTTRYYLKNSNGHYFDHIWQEYVYATHYIQPYASFDTEEQAIDKLKEVRAHEKYDWIKWEVWKDEIVSTKCVDNAQTF